MDVTTNLNDVTFEPISLTTPVDRHVVTATETDPDGNTSEFSDCSMDDTIFGDGFEGHQPARLGIGVSRTRFFRSEIMIQKSRAAALPRNCRNTSDTRVPARRRTKLTRILSTEL
jgi:hypothetical protein